MRNSRIKWFILWIPTVTIGLWEYVRHVFLLPYLSMELGNWLAPFIVLAVTLTLVRGLFRKLEESQAALQQEREQKASLQERELLAAELHDGIAQSLFLLAVRLDRMERARAGSEDAAAVEQLKQTVRQVHDDVRQSIASLRQPPSSGQAGWVVPLRTLLEETAGLLEADYAFHWTIADSSLSDKEKIELHACLREALTNVRKHAEARRVTVSGEPLDDGGFRCSVTDDGIGFGGDPFRKPDRFGMRMIRERAARMKWAFTAERREGLTVVELVKPGKRKDGEPAASAT